MTSLALADRSTASANVFDLNPDEPIRFDPERLSNFCTEHGVQAEDQIAQVLFQIEERLLLATWQIETQELRGLERSAEMLIELAGTIGMVTLEQAAQAVKTCVSTGNAAALPACAARLARLSDYGKLGNWDLIDGGVA